MAVSALEDKTRQPDAAALAAVLGPALPRWDELVNRVHTRFGPVAIEWKHPGGKHGWSMRLTRGGRNLIYLIPGHGRFLAALIFGERAVQAIRESRVPADVKALVEAATPYVEGRGIRLEVRRKKDLDVIETLLNLKLG